jgi:hypothetical protein
MSDCFSDIACLDPVYIDGIYSEAVMSTGANFMLPFFRFVPVKTESGIILQRTPVLLLICPHSSLKDYGSIPELVDERRSPLVIGQRLLAN